MTMTTFGAVHDNSSAAGIDDERMKTYFQYHEIGQIHGILRDKYNLF
jgi:hypothetical protein